MKCLPAHVLAGVSFFFAQFFLCLLMLIVFVQYCTLCITVFFAAAALLRVSLTLWASRAVMSLGSCWASFFLKVSRSILPGFLQVDTVNAHLPHSLS